MTGTVRSDIVAVVTDALGVATRYQRGPTWPKNADKWMADLDRIDGRLAGLAAALVVRVPPMPRGHWSRIEREAGVVAIAERVPSRDAKALPTPFALR